MFGEFNPDLSDVFSLGITFIRLVLILIDVKERANFK